MKALLLLSQPLQYDTNALLQQALQQAGWKPDEYQTETNPAAAGANGSLHQCIIAFGDGAARASVAGDWESGWAEQRRGYVWEGVAGCKVLTTLDVEHCLLRKDPSGINGMLLVADLERGRREYQSRGISRTPRSIRIVHEASDAPVLGGRTVACDIECTDPSTLLCIGFAPSATEAYVFVGRALDHALGIVADPTVRKVFQNGAFDAYFLKTRCGVEVASYTDDCMIAWHALWPEIAGKGQRSSKRTKKSLAFLISLYCESPAWHKEYDTDENGMYELCGIDCCTTLEIIGKQLQEMEEQDVMGIYRHEMAMQPVLVAIQERGMLVDEGSRLAALTQLTARGAAAEDRMRSLAEPILREHSEKLAKPHLFFGKKRCACCNGGKGKRMACWTCAGLEGPARKKEAHLLGPCKVCGGVGSFETFEFNPASDEQKKDLFYEALKLPRKYKDGKPTVDEKALKNILGALP